jgi:HicB family
MQALTIRVPELLLARAKVHAKEHGMSLAAWIRMAIAIQLERDEYYRRGGKPNLPPPPSRKR